jgi:pimeloyl-ACP methyl ester carboxylesterase
MATVNHDGYDIPYVVDGDGRGPHLVFAHGLMGTGSSQRLMLSPLVDAGWTVVTFDQRGHGASTPVTEASGYNPDAMGADLWAIADDIGLDRCWIGGGSMGAATSYCAARAKPERVEGLIQAVPALRDEPHALVWLFEGLADRVRDAGVEGLIETIREFMTSMGRTEQDEVFAAELRSHRDAASIELALRNVPKWLLPDVPSAFASVPFPVVVQGWDDDPVHPLQTAKDVAAAAGVALVQLDQSAVLDDRTAAGRALAERLAAVRA